MDEPPLRDLADVRQLKSPDDPRMFSGHDARLSERYPEPPVKSARKELEGMARLVVAVEDDLDGATLERLLAAMRRERDRLQAIEDEAVR